MTSDEYRRVLSELTERQRSDLNEHIFKGNQPTVDTMVYVFEKYGDVEQKAVFWLTKNVPGFQHKTQSDRVAEANIRSAELAERSLALSQDSLKVSQRSLRIAYWAFAVSVVALIVSIITIWK